MVDTASIFNASNPGLFIKIIAAIVILIIGVIVARIVSNLIKKLLMELELEKILNEQAGVKVPVIEFISSITKYIVYFIAIIMALNQIGLTTTILHIILIIILTIIVAFIILAFKDFIPNLAAGFFIYQKKILEKGDKIKVKDFEGKVIDVSLVETQIKTKKGEVVHIPNSVMIKNEIIKLKK